MAAVVSAVELIYRELCKPVPAKPKAKAVEKDEEPSITRKDVESILAHERFATPDQLQYIIDHAKHFDLTTSQHNKIALQMTIAIAAKLRGSQGAREDPTSPLLRAIGIQETPFGLLHGADRFAAELKAGTRAIMSCRDHHPPLCRCWRASRDWLHGIRERFGERSPETYAALRVWFVLEHVELTARSHNMNGDQDM